jgi:hypothetical protein
MAAKKDTDKTDKKGKKRRKYAKPRLIRHGELSQTALAHSY